MLDCEMCDQLENQRLSQKTEHGRGLAVAQFHFGSPPYLCSLSPRAARMGCGHNFEERCEYERYELKVGRASALG